eukprot:TRINITY_DN4121_c0_g1_i1.p1 TRINITY_DN4121_c0_g1~~TRINITY_DN4121_c0_g1_i1.p1  ORF type:complete len:1714 (-),score=320.65 TRINITY_DN4121_c0_g1_i1:72-5213(-)
MAFVSAARRARGRRRRGLQRSAVAAVVGIAGVSGEPLGPVPMQAGHGGERTCKGYEKQWHACPDLPACDKCVPQDCHFHSWGDWYSAGGCIGLCWRHRGIEIVNNECGKPCWGPQKESRPCPVMECVRVDLDCKLSAWTEWSGCHSDDDQKHRSRRIVVEPLYGGKACDGPTSETVPCAAEFTLDCLASDWNDWDSCSRSCGGGYHNRNRRVTQRATLLGRPCNMPLRATEPCNTQPCPGHRDCDLGDWGAWSACGPHDVQQYRSRKVSVEARSGGEPCSGAMREARGCPTKLIVEPCKIADWTDWQDCDKTCGGGQTMRKRLPTNPPINGGACPDAVLAETRECGMKQCTEIKAEDCIFDDWGEWTACSSECGQGNRQRERVVARSAKPGGDACAGPLQEAFPCQLRPCGVMDCLWGDWESWSDCSAPCGGGDKRRNRLVKQMPQYGGKLCEPEDKLQIVPCNTENCEKCVDAKWQGWSAWGPCSSSCGVGFQSRHRDMALQPNNCGKAVVGLEDDYRVCNRGECDPDANCSLSSWGEWTACSATCFGMRQRSRRVAVQASGRGHPCSSEPLREMSPCHPGAHEDTPEACEGARPRDCQFSPWASWSGCSATCDGGQRERLRHVLTPSSTEGAACAGPLHQVMACGATSCEAQEKCLDCLWADWDDWSSCKCGQHYRVRHIRQTPNECGKPCSMEAAKEVSDCDDPLCGQVKFCAWTEWTALGQASRTCGNATLIRSRQLEIFESESDLPSYLDAPGAILQDHEQKAVAIRPRSNTAMCVKHRRGPNHKIVSMAPCSGEDTQAWLFTKDGYIKPLEDQAYCLTVMGYKDNVQTPPVGAPLELFACGKAVGQLWSFDADSRTIWMRKHNLYCVDRLQDNVDVHVSSPLVLRECDMQMSQNWEVSTTRVPRFLFEGSSGMMTCTGHQLRSTVVQMPPCNVELGPQDCAFGDWQDWSEATTAHLCERLRRIAQGNENGGAPCDGPLVETKKCACASCNHTAQDCLFSDWEVWSHCSSPQAQRFRGRTRVRDAHNGGLACEGPLRETTSCNGFEEEMVAPCTFSSWAEWDSCSSSCGNGYKRRNREINVRARFGGEACRGKLEELQPCFEADCDSEDDLDCLWDSWKDWGVCQFDGQRYRSRDIAQESSGHGKHCEGPMRLMEACDSAVDCVVTPWSTWDHCDKACGGGQMQRHRGITQPPKRGGKACPQYLEETMGCNNQRCHASDSDCQVSMWAEWGGCSVSCGHGDQTRSRYVMTHARQAYPAGVGCRNILLEARPCPEPKACPHTDCKWSDWSEWAGCSMECDGGQRSRTRFIKVMPSRGGKVCDALPREEVEPCNTMACEKAGRCIDAQWGDWSQWNICSRSCRGGFTWRTRIVVQEANTCGKPAVGEAREVKECNEHIKCIKAVDCQFGEWDVWSSCTSVCSGVKRRSRVIAVHGEGEGSFCEGPLKQTYPCNPGVGQATPTACLRAPAIDCRIGEWDDWTACTSECDGGQQSHSRTILNEPENGGKSCEGPLKETRPCNTDRCPVRCTKTDCVWGDWEDWGGCVSCGGQRHRSRHIKTQASCKGEPCKPHMSQESGNCTRSCGASIHYCAWDNWEPWAACTSTCGGGVRSRERSLVVQKASQVRMLDSTAGGVQQKFEVADAETQRNGLQNEAVLRLRSHQELLVAFSSGLFSMAFLAFLQRRCLRPRDDVADADGPALHERLANLSVE